METDALGVIKRGLDLFNRREYEASIETLGPDITWDTTAAVPDGDVYRGRAEVLALWRDIGERWRGFRIEPERWVEGDGVVLLLGRLIGRGVGSGVPVETTWDQVWRIEDDVVVSCENYTDRGRAWRAAGLEPDS